MKRQNVCFSFGVGWRVAGSSLVAVQYLVSGRGSEVPLLLLWW